MSKKHARLSPSSADRWTSCTASPAAQDGIPNENSDASRAGTTCHQVQEELLLNPDRDPQVYLGAKLVFWSHPESDSKGETWNEEFHAGMAAEVQVEAEVEVTQEMVDAVVSAVTFIREQHQLLGGELLVEQRVPIGHFTGEEDAYGSADVILLGSDWLHVMDSKFGRKRVHASKVIRHESVDFITGEILPLLLGPNLQMASYALGAVHAHDVFGEVKTVTMTIVQPFIGHTDSFTCTIAELREVEKFLAAKAEETRTAPRFVPEYDNCFFCRAKGNCYAQTSKALGTVFDGFGEADSGILRRPDPLKLGSQYALVPFVQQWAKDVEEATYRALQNGEPVVRNDGVPYKLVPGRAAKRTWRDEEAAAAVLHAARIPRDRMYLFQLISPAMAEAMSKQKRPPKGHPPQPAELPPSKWKDLQPLIAQGESAPQIALATDPRPALCKADGFEDAPTPIDPMAALFGE